MAFFGVTVETIDVCRPHPDADRLDLCTLRGLRFQFVTKRGAHHAGERVLYFPIDSLIPENIQEILGVSGYLAGGSIGADGNKIADRVKTVRLRGEISQGIVSPIALLGQLSFSAASDDPSSRDSAALTAFLGVQKYEPPPVMGGVGVNLSRLPSGLSTYDIEGADRFAGVAECLLDLPVHITEKLEGSNFSVYASLDGTISVNQRSFSIHLDEGANHIFWHVAREQGLIELAREILATAGDVPFVALYGEMLGPKIQGNYYRLAKNSVRLFDVRLGARWASPEVFHELLSDAVTVPVLARNVPLRSWLAGKSIQEAADGQSVLAPVAREGIVIRPMTPASDKTLSGRLILKQRSPSYLAKTDF